MRILVTGGAGYIASFMTRALFDAQHEVIILDSLERGHKNLLDSRARFYRGNILDKTFLDSVFTSVKIDAVIHFAAYISMGESMKNPFMYFENNTYGTLNLLNVMQRHGVSKIIFSSTAGVYGNPVKLPIPEDHPKNPENPYGESKLMTEKILSWYQKIYGISFSALRYFNAAGAALDGSLGERHNPETHLIPNAIQAALTNSEFLLFGNDYKTPDGTCVRDYVHVFDLVQAHLLALEELNNNSGAYYYNIGTGKGYSNKEILDMVKKVSRVDFLISVKPRRSGDADELVADVTRIQSELGFKPKYSDLETIIKTAWDWHKKVIKL